MNLRAAVAAVVPLLVAFALTGCAATNNDRVAVPTVVASDRVFLQSRSLGLMPRAQSAVAPTHSLALIISDHERKIGR